VTAFDPVLRASPPTTPDHRISRFPDWVYQSSHGRGYGSGSRSIAKEERMALGTFSHRQIDLFFHLAWTQNRLTSRSPKDWEILHTEADSQRLEPYCSSRLRVAGTSMRGFPDVVLRHRASGPVLIIERKTTYIEDARIPESGWPNVEAQLWAYSWLDEWAAAPDALLVGQLWRRHQGGLVLCHTHPSWTRSDPGHHLRCLAWFRRYGGECSNAKT